MERMRCWDSSIPGQISLERLSRPTMSYHAVEMGSLETVQYEQNN